MNKGSLVRITVVVAVLFGGKWAYDRHLRFNAPVKSAVAVSPSSVDPKEWPILPSTTKPKLGKRPSLPPSPVVNTPIEAARAFIGVHPDKEISVDFLAAIDRGEVKIRLDGPSDVEAMFSAYDGEQTLWLYPGFVRGDLSYSKALIVMTRVTHENVHRKQYLAAPPEERARFWEAQYVEGREDILRGCEMVWRQEREAFQVSCRKGHEWGFMELDSSPYGFCERVNDASFDQALFFKMTTSDQKSMAMSYCHLVWAQLAGHPHPEAFK